MNTPKIRFKGFEDDWEQRKLSDCAEFRRGSFPQPYGNKDWYDGKGAMPFVQVADVSSDMKLVNDTKQKISKLAQPMSVFAEKGSVLVTLQGSIGRVAITQYGAFVDRTVLIFDKYKDDIDKKFWAYIIKEKFEYEAKKAPGGTIKTITKEVLANFDLMLPCYAEQSILADYLIKLDHLITLHQCKCDETKELKKFMLQKMFPKNGEKNPEIRFEGFTDDWEQRKLGEIYGSIGNAFVGTATPYYVDQGHFYLESNNVKDGQINHNSEIFINDEFYEKQRDKWLHAGDMVMVQSGHVGHAAVIPKELDNTAAHALIMFRNAKEKIEPYFLNYEYQTDKTKKKIENITTGNTIKHILASDMQEFEVDIPKYEEQKIIAGYFRTIDHLITLHQRKCEKLKELKKFMLQNMFV